MLQTIINTFKPKDFYDLDVLLQINGYSEEQANYLCDLIDSKGRAPLYIRKLIGVMVNRQHATYEDIRELYTQVPHIFKVKAELKTLRECDDYYQFFVNTVKTNLADG